MKIRFFLLCFTSLLSKTSFAEPDTLYQQSCDELLITLSNNIEKYAKTDLVFSNQFYIAKKATFQPSMLEVAEVVGTAHEIYLIDFSKIIVGKNVYFKDWGKGFFSIIFSKEICIKKRNQKNKKFEIMFATDIADRKTDYVVLGNNIKRDLEAIQSNCK